MEPKLIVAGIDVHKKPYDRLTVTPADENGNVLRLV